MPSPHRHCHRHRLTTSHPRLAVQVNAKFFEVNEELSAINKAPLTAKQ